MLDPVGHHDLLVFWVQLAVLLGAARLLGGLARRIGLPAVVGELGAGVVLGPTVFGRLWPSGFEWFLPGGELSSGLLLGVAWIGIALLLVTTGFETDLGLITRLGRPATIVSFTSIVVPLAAGLAMGGALPDEFLGPDATRAGFTAFVGLAVAVSSLAVVAKILAELGHMRRDFGQMTVAAGMANDTVGWLLLGAVSALAASGEVDLGELGLTLFGMAVFLVAAFTLGQRGVDRALRRVRQEGENIAGAVTVTCLVALAFAAVTQWIGIEGVLGAFVAGMLVHRSRFHQEQAEDRIEVLTVAVFAPLFFATAGLRVDIGLLVEEGALGWALLLLAVAVVAKFVGAAGGALLAGRDRREALALGAGLNARGTLEVVIATVGLSLGVLGTVAYTAILIVPLVTAALAAVGLRLAVRDWAGTEEEQERLQREAAMERNVVVKDSRALLPTRGGSGSVVAAQVLDLVWPEPSPVTVVALEDEEIPTVDVTPIENVLHGRPLEVLRVPYEEAGARLRREAKLGFGVVVVSLPDQPDPELGPLTPLVADLLSDLEQPLVLVRKARRLDGRRLPPAFARALVPVAGGRSARAAQELAFGMSRRIGTEIVLAHVLDRARPRKATRRWRARERAPVDEVVDRLLGEAVAHAGEFDVAPTTMVRRAASPVDELARITRQDDVDVIILGATVRTVEGHPFLGHTAEHLLEEVDATVVVVVSPAATPRAVEA